MYGYINFRGLNIVVILCRMFCFVVWKFGEIGEVVMVNKVLVLCYEIFSVFVIGFWLLFIIIFVVCFFVGMVLIIFGELEIYFLVCMLVIFYSVFN